MTVSANRIRDKPVEQLIEETNILLDDIDTFLHSSLTGSIDVSDRATRLLGIVYGNLAQLQQRPVSFDLYTALRYLGAEIDPRAIRALTVADAVSAIQSGAWTTGRTWNLGALDTPDLSDRAARLLGVIYGSQAAQLKQTAVNFNSQVELATGATLYDARQTRALTAADIVSAGFVDTLGATHGYETANGKPRVSTNTYTYDIAEGNISGHANWSKIGYNPALVANTEADLWSKTGVYVFPTAASQMRVISSSAGNEDLGTSIFNGTSNGGSTTTLSDSTKNFLGGTAVQAGDCVILDKAMDGGRTPEWGYVTAVGATTLTVANGFSSGGTGSGRNYYVIDKNAAGKTGAHAVKINYLDSNYAEKKEIVILNGNTLVLTVNTDLFRINSFRVIATGSGNAPVGNLTLDVAAGTVYSYITAAFTRARNVQYTVPAGKLIYVTSVSCAYGFTDVNAKPHYCRMYTRANLDPDTKFLTGSIFYPYTEVVVGNVTIQINLINPTKLPAKTDIKVSAIADAPGIATVALRGWIETA